MSARSPSSPGAMPVQPRPAAVVEYGFVPVRAKLLEVAAFLDRVERYGVEGDFRCAALRQALAVLADHRPGRARRVLEALSDPTVEPDAVSSGKAATGAWRGPVH